MEHTGFIECDVLDAECRGKPLTPNDACWFDYHSNEAARNKVNVALKEIGWDSDQSADFMVDFVGKKFGTPQGAGHLGEYRCEVVAEKFMSIQYFDPFEPTKP